MRLAVLGPVRLEGADGVVTVTPRKARELLTLLALEYPDGLSLDAIAARMWDEPPPAATKTIQGHLSRLRMVLRAAGSVQDGVRGGPAGYRLELSGALDVVEFRARVSLGRQTMLAASWAIAVSALGAARALARGDLELPATTAGLAQRTWFDELCNALAEEQIEAQLHAGQIAVAIAELALLTDAHPLRERLWELRTVALARSGRTAEALRAFGQARDALAEVGVEPGAALLAIEQDVLAGLTPTVPATLIAASPLRSATPVAVIASADAITPPVAYVAVGRVHVAYCSVGAAAADYVIVNPGTLPIDSYLEEPRLAERIRQLTEFARVTWLDRRGFGLSDRCAADQLPTVSDWVQDLAAVLDAIDAPRPFLYAAADTTAVVLEFASAYPDRVGGVVLTNAYARFTRTDDYPYGLDPVMIAQSTAETSSPRDAAGGFDLLTIIAPSVAHDQRFRAWWDTSGRRGASPQVSHVLRQRHNTEDLRDLISRVDLPVLHLVNPTSPAHDPGHDRYIAEHLRQVETHVLPGPDELWWLDESGEFLRRVRAFMHC